MCDREMTRFEIIPFVFELAKKHKGWCEKDGKFCMRYDEYTKYVKMFDELGDDEQKQLMDKVKRSKK